MLRILRTCPVEARSSVKIPLRNSGLRPLSHPSSLELAGLPLPRRSHPGKNSCKAGESTTPRHLVFACGSRLQEDDWILKANRRPACGNVVEYAVCCGFQRKSWWRVWPWKFALMPKRVSKMDTKSLFMRCGVNRRCALEIGAVLSKLRALISIAALAHSPAVGTEH